ncbi:unnamed protein product [Diplocarpon coronariae]
MFQTLDEKVVVAQVLIVASFPLEELVAALLADVTGTLDALLFCPPPTPATAPLSGATQAFAVTTILASFGRTPSTVSNVVWSAVQQSTICGGPRYAIPESIDPTIELRAG